MNKVSSKLVTTNNNNTNSLKKNSFFEKLDAYKAKHNEKIDKLSSKSIENEIYSFKPNINSYNSKRTIDDLMVNNIIYIRIGIKIKKKK